MSCPAPAIALPKPLLDVLRSRGWRRTQDAIGELWIHPDEVHFLEVDEWYGEVEVTVYRWWASDFDNRTYPADSPQLIAVLATL